MGKRLRAGLMASPPWTWIKEKSYGGAATTAFRGIQLLNTITSVRWSGLAVREALPSLSTLASNSGQQYVRDRFLAFGMLSRTRQVSAVGRAGLPRPSLDVLPRPS